MSDEDTPEGVVSKPLAFQDTGEVELRLTDAMDHPDEVPIGTLIRELVRRTADEVRRFDNTEEPASKKFLGRDYKTWTGDALKGALILLVFLITWYNTVNSNLESKASYDDVEQAVKSGVSSGLGAHEKNGGHPQLETNATAIQNIRESQIRQETSNASQTQVLQEIKTDLRQLRYGRTRAPE